MTHQDPYAPPPPRGSRPPDIDPNELPPGSNPPRHRHPEGEGSRLGVFVALVVAAVIVAGIMLWAGSGGQQTATNPPAETTGQGNSPAPAPPKK